MMQPVVIDKVCSKEILNEGGPDVLEIEWFENKKQKLTRATNNGVVIELRLGNRKEWQHGNGLYCEGKLIAVIAVKTCLTICFQAKNTKDAADFCYFIGNQHLPVFWIQEQQFAVPYDGRLYEQLTTRYNHQINLTDARLFSSQSLRWLAKNAIHEN